MRETRTRVILLCIAFIGMAFYHFRLDIFSPSLEYALMPSSLSISDEAKAQVILLKEAPLLMRNRRAQIEELFWRYTPLDSLLRYGDYINYYYRQTNHLTTSFKEGQHYDDPSYSPWNNGVMDWRNHFEDRVGVVYIVSRKDGTGDYYTKTYESGYGCNFMIDISNREKTRTSYQSIKDLYLVKRKELGIIEDEKD